jgi:hypothetical protein
MNVRSLLIATVCCLPLVAGCGQSGTRAGSKVTGTVKYKGNPVAGAKIVFTDGKDTSGGSPNGPTATTDEDGQYALIGVPPGSYKVVVYKLVPKKGAILPPEGEGMDLEQMEASGLGKHELPQKYSRAATTTLVAQVGEGAQEENFDLK